MLNTQHIETSDRLLNFAQRLADRLLSNPSSSTEKSLVFSPLSVGGALQLLLLGARGQTYNELTQLFGYSQSASSAVIHQDFERLIGQLVASNSNLGATAEEVDHFVQVANALFLDSGFTLRPDYRTVVLSVYRAETFTVNFKSESVVQEVNQWVADRTRGKITEILSQRPAESTKMMIASTIYYNARWKTTFYESLTKPRDFWLEGRSRDPIKVDMMALGGKLPFYNAVEHDCRILALPYKNTTSAMYILLPNNSSRSALMNLHRRMNADVINGMIKKMVVSTSIVFLPKMHLTSSTDISQELAGFGVRSLFNPSSADLALIASDNSQTGSQLFGGSIQKNISSYPSHLERYEDVLIFSRFNEEGETMNKQRNKRNTYKVGSQDRKSEDPLRMKDFVLRKRITKENKLNKKGLRHKRQVGGIGQALQSLDNQRYGSMINPGLFATEIRHKVDLIVNEKGTEGGAGEFAFLRYEFQKAYVDSFLFSYACYVKQKRNPGGFQGRGTVHVLHST